MVNVIDLSARRERWTTAYSWGDIILSVSNQGRIHLRVGEEVRTIGLIEAVTLMGQLSKSFDEVSGL